MNDLKTVFSKTFEHKSHNSRVELNSKSSSNKT